MKNQNSYNNEFSTLYLVSTPIGNLEDITYRAVNILKSVNFIFAEDTRVTSKLLKHYDIKVETLQSYHSHNETSISKKILKILLEGSDVALVSDAGMPLINDPGFDLVKLCEENDVNIVTLPGANAALTALVSSGIAPYPFVFYGFLDSNKKKSYEQLKTALESKYTSIFYESTHRIINTIEQINNNFPNREISVSRELTKKHEQIITGTAKYILESLTVNKGEYVLIISPNKETIEFENISIIEHIQIYLNDGYKNMDAIKQVAKDRGLKKQVVYDKYHKS